MLRCSARKKLNSYVLYHISSSGFCCSLCTHLLHVLSENEHKVLWPEQMRIAHSLRKCIPPPPATMDETQRHIGTLSICQKCTIFGSLICSWHSSGANAIAFIHSPSFIYFISRTYIDNAELHQICIYTHEWVTSMRIVMFIVDCTNTATNIVHCEREKNAICSV